MESTVPMTQEQNTMPLVHDRLLGVLTPGSPLRELSDSLVVNVKVVIKLRFWAGLSSPLNMAASRLRAITPYRRRRRIRMGRGKRDKSQTGDQFHFQGLKRTSWRHLVRCGTGQGCAKDRRQYEQLFRSSSTRQDRGTENDIRRMMAQHLA